MNRYVFRFEKTGNLRFISHLDLQRLFRRSIKRAQIKVAYTQGYNPHEMINVVQALSLGFESTGDYFEIVTPFAYDAQDLMDRFNQTFPEGLKFTSVRVFTYSSRNLSPKTHSALYEAILPLAEGAELDIASFVSAPQINIMKKDKKTKKPVEKNVKDFVYSVDETGRADGSVTLSMRLRCASNETLNPMNLLASLWKYNGLDFAPELVRIYRREIFIEEGGKLIPLSEYHE